MVRINIINPERLADQHLIAEYNEILMLLGYVRKYPSLNDNVPQRYGLGRGHILFFKNKLKYLKNRHDIIKSEMNKRGFKIEKTINLDKFEKMLINDWVPELKDFEIIKKRLIEKINLKPNYYKYYGEKRPREFFIKLIKKEKRE